MKCLIFLLSMEHVVCHIKSLLSSQIKSEYVVICARTLARLVAMWASCMRSENSEPNRSEGKARKKLIKMCQVAFVRANFNWLTLQFSVDRAIVLLFPRNTYVPEYIRCDNCYYAYTITYHTHGRTYGRIGNGIMVWTISACQTDDFHIISLVGADVDGFSVDLFHMRNSQKAKCLFNNRIISFWSAVRCWPLNTLNCTVTHLVERL